MTPAHNAHSKFEAELRAFASLDRQSRIVVLVIIAHDLTVGVRSSLLNLPSPNAIEEIQALNEYIHQVTGRITICNPQSGQEECDLLRDIADQAEAKRLKWAVMRRLGPALRHVSTHAKAAEIA
jgi:hypothetical protein